MISIEAFSPAKININLEVLEKRSDGFHNIKTIFMLTDLYDKLFFEPSEKIELLCEGNPNLPTDSSNLIVRAAIMLKENSGTNKGVKIKLNKVIPTGAGLGGGSSNAAVTLMALNILWNLNYSDEKLMELGNKLGSDVPFFIFGKQVAIGEGKGEILHEIPDFLDKWIVLACPEISVETKGAYNEITKLLTKRDRNVNLYDLYEKCLCKEVSLKELFYNDFEKVVLKKYPDIESIKRSFLIEHADASVLTGSGATVVGVFKDKASANKWQSIHPGLKTFCVRPSQVVGRRLCKINNQEEKDGNFRS